MKASATEKHEQLKTQTVCDLHLYEVLIKFLVNYTERETKINSQACRILLQLDRLSLILIHVPCILYYL